MLKTATFLLFLGFAAAMPLKENQHWHRSENATVPKSGVTGVDVSSLVYPDTFKCMKAAGVNFAIIRAYQSTCEPDGNAIHTVFNAKQAGIEHVDVYLFPSPHCSRSASQQVNDMVAALKNADYGTIWLDIEGHEYWHLSQSENQAFFKDLLAAASSRKRTGVYTSASQWDPIMGSSFTAGSGHDLWYAHYDDNPSFSDFASFGGWSRPAMKQYKGDTTLCSAGVDMNWYP